MFGNRAFWVVCMGEGCRLEHTYGGLLVMGMGSVWGLETEMGIYAARRREDSEIPAFGSSEMRKRQFK